jgi:hypothetical protein
MRRRARVVYPDVENKHQAIRPGDYCSKLKESNRWTAFKLLALSSFM